MIDNSRNFVFGIADFLLPARKVAFGVTQALGIDITVGKPDPAFFKGHAFVSRVRHSAILIAASTLRVLRGER